MAMRRMAVSSLTPSAVHILVYALLVSACECQHDDAVVLVQSWAKVPPQEQALGSTKTAQRFKSSHVASMEDASKSDVNEQSDQHSHVHSKVHSKAVSDAVASLKSQIVARAQAHAQERAQLRSHLHYKNAVNKSDNAHNPFFGNREKPWHKEGFSNWSDWFHRGHGTYKERKKAAEVLSAKRETERPKLSATAHEHKSRKNAEVKSVGAFSSKAIEDTKTKLAGMAWPAYGELPKPMLLTMLNRARLGNRLFQWSALLAIAKEAGIRAVAPPNEKYSPTSTPQISNLGALIWGNDEYEWLNKHDNKCHIWDNANPPTLDYNIENLANWTLGGYPKGEIHIKSSQQPQRGMNWARMFADAILNTPTPSPCTIVELDGFWQRAEFFVHHLDWLRPTFWSVEVADKAKRVMDNWVDKTVLAGALVGIHLRLGDYIGMGRNLNMQYYRDGLSEVKRRRNVDELTCMVFSDDINLAVNVSLELSECTKRIPVYPCTELGKGYSCRHDDRIVNDRVSFYMMSQLPNIIIADSTYSFWAAILAPSKPLVISPRIVQPERIARRGDYSYLNSPLYGWVDIDASVGDHTSQAVQDKLRMVEEEDDYVTMVHNSEWAA